MCVRVYFFIVIVVGVVGVVLAQYKLSEHPSRPSLFLPMWMFLHLFIRISVSPSRQVGLLGLQWASEGIMVLKDGSRLVMVRDSHPI